MIKFLLFPFWSFVAMGAIVNVTNDDINFGVRRDADRCAVAIALSRTVGLHCKVMEIRNGYEGEFNCGRVINLPDDAQLQIYNFDEGRDIKPFKFEIKL